MDYCESPKKKRNRSSPQGYRKRVADEKAKIEIKSERISRIKKAIFILNRQSDKREIEELDDVEVAEYHDLLDDDNNGPQSIDDIGVLHSTHNDEAMDDCVAVGVGANNQVNIITTEIAPVEVDNVFSCKYGFTINVSSIKKNQIRLSIT